MEILAELLQQKMNQAWVGFFSMWWYWLPAGFGFAFRFRLFNSEKRAKEILRDIGIIALLSMAWDLMNENKLENNAGVMVIVLTLVYIFYGIAKDCEDTGGTTESLLLIVKGVFVTTLSFQTLKGTIAGTVFTCVLAALAYRAWSGFEKKTDLYEIFFLCIEAIILSLYTKINHIEGSLLIFLFVFYEETAIFLLNYSLKYITAKILNEADDYDDF